jgi:hypothetical protein
MRAYLLTWLFGSWRRAKISLVLSFNTFGKRLKRSPRAIIILAFTPKSIWDLKSWNSNSMF